MNKEIKKYTEMFHYTYEMLALNFGYETRKDTKKFDFDTPNGKLMYATVEKIISPILEENQELKKQLEKIKNEPLTNRIGRIDSVIANIYSRNRTHQKEFIEWLEDYIDALKQQKETIEGLDIGEEHILMILEEVLEKYKGIIGGSNENNSI